MNTPELPKKTVIAWRQFAGTEAFDDGINHLLRIHAPRARGTTVVEVTEAALKWAGYMEALEDVQNTLTSLPEPAKTIDETPLGG